MKVEVPQCFKDFWALWKDFLDEWNLEQPGTVETISGPKEVQGSDLLLEWNFCGNHQLIGDSLGVYDELIKSGPVCYPGRLCNQITNTCLPEGEEED